MHHDDEHAETPPELVLSIDHFLDDSIRHILKYEDAERYFADLNDILTRTGIEAWFKPDVPFWAIGRAIWNAVPLPSRNFRCAPLPEPRRNDPCPCGSGKTYKRCCQPLQSEQTTPLITEMPVIHCRRRTMRVSGTWKRRRKRK